MQSIGSFSQLHHQRRQKVYYLMPNTFTHTCFSSIKGNSEDLLRSHIQSKRMLNKSVAYIFFYFPFLFGFQTQTCIYTKTIWPDIAFHYQEHKRPKINVLRRRIKRRSFNNRARSGKMAFLWTLHHLQSDDADAAAAAASGWNPET